MIKVNIKHILLYLIGIVLLIFGNRQFFEKYKEEIDVKAKKDKKTKDAETESARQFEVQNLVYDSENKVWKNKNISFSTVSVGKINFEELKKIEQGKLKKESHDVENASDSL